MRKRPHQLVVLSSSDEEGCNHNAHSSKFTASDSKSIARSECKKFKDDKGSSRSCIQLQKANHMGTEDWPSLFPDAFPEVPLQQSIVSKDTHKIPRPSQCDQTELWVDKYKPRELTDLAVNKKKVADVKAWIEGQLNSSMESSGSHVLLLTGPTGVGKTATIHLLTDILGIEICAWETPTPMVWREYIHLLNSGATYISKLDEFEAFVGAIRKYPVLHMGSSKRARKLKNAMLILIDDLPVPNNKESCQRLCQCLQTLALSAQFPTIVLITEFTETGDTGGPSQMILELELALEQGGATKIAFNPLTTKAITKTLTQIWTAEYHRLPPDWLSYISESSGGDIRHAVNSLQFLCPGQASGTWELRGFGYPAPSKSKSRNQSLKKVVQPTPSTSFLEYTDKIKSSMGRDGTLSLFHALGKFLHNKRQRDQNADSGQSSIVLKDKLVRYPLKMDMPEVVLSQAHAEAGTFCAFLHENVLDFISEEAIDDAWMAASYLSDTDCLLGVRSSSYRRRLQSLLEWDEIDSTFIVESLAGSVMSRGVLFANSHPVPPRWQAIRGPTLWQVERSSHKKRREMLLERWASCGLPNTCGFLAWATEYKPVMCLLGQLAFHMQVQPVRDSRQEWNKRPWDSEEVGTGETESLEIDDIICDGDILSTLNINSDYTHVNSSLNEISQEMEADEIEEW